MRDDLKAQFESTTETVSWAEGGAVTTTTAAAATGGAEGLGLIAEVTGDGATARA